MVGVLISVVIVGIMIRMLLRRYQPQFVLYGGGILLILIAVAMSQAGLQVGQIIPKGAKATGFFGFDPFEIMRALMSTRVAGLGLTIMAAGGFAKYMNTIGASRAMVGVVVSPLRLIRSPYIVLAGAFLIGQTLKMVIPSASGLGLMLMVTVFPILLRLGLGPLSATAAVACTGGIDFGPADGQAILASEIAEITPTQYFVTVIPVLAVTIAVTTLVVVFWQWHMDKRAGHTIAAGLAQAEQARDDAGEQVPVLYSLLPVLPLVLLIVFSEYFVASVSLGVVPAMFLSLCVGLVCEIFRHRDVQRVSKEMMAFFEGMGAQFTAVVSLVVAGEVFAQGLKAVGAVDTLIETVKAAGFSPMVMVLLMTVFILVITIIMGSGNAAFFSFAALVPDIAKGTGVSALAMIMPLQFTSGIGRIMSPISGAMIAEAGIAGISPFDLVKRTFVPMLAAAVVSTVMSIVITL